MVAFGDAFDRPHELERMRNVSPENNGGEDCLDQMALIRSSCRSKTPTLGIQGSCLAVRAPAMWYHWRRRMSVATTDYKDGQDPKCHKGDLAQLLAKGVYPARLGFLPVQGVQACISATSKCPCQVDQSNTDHSALSTAVSVQHSARISYCIRKRKFYLHLSLQPCTEKQCPSNLTAATLNAYPTGMLTLEC
jgi:hypothetical protein